MANFLEFIQKAQEVKTQLAEVKSNWMEDVVDVLKLSPNLSEKEKQELTRRKVDNAINGTLRNDIWLEEIERAMEFVLEYYKKERKTWSTQKSQYAQKARLQKAV